MYVVSNTQEHDVKFKHLPRAFSSCKKKHSFDISLPKPLSHCSQPYSIAFVPYSLIQNTDPV